MDFRCLSILVLISFLSLVLGSNIDLERQFNDYLNLSEKTQDPQVAYTYAEKALALKPTHPFALLSMGFAFADLGDHLSSCKYFRYSFSQQVTDIDQWERNSVQFIKKKLNDEVGPLQLGFNSDLLALPLPTPHHSIPGITKEEQNQLLSPEIVSQLLYNIGFNMHTYKVSPGSPPSPSLPHLPVSVASLSTVSPSVSDDDVVYLSVAYLLTSLRLMPFAEPFLKLGASLRSLGSPRHSVWALQLGISQHPDKPHFYHYIGDMLNNDRQFTTALSFYNRSLEVGGPNAQVLCAMGDVAANLVEPIVSASFFKQAYKISPSPESIVGLENAYRNSCEFGGLVAVAPLISKMMKPLLGVLVPPSPYPPYHALYSDVDPPLQLAISRSWALAVTSESRAVRPPFQHTPFFNYLTTTHDALHTTDNSIFEFCSQYINYTSTIHPHDIPSATSPSQFESWSEVSTSSDNSASKPSVFYTHPHTPFSLSPPVSLSALWNEKITVGYISRRFESYAGAQLSLAIYGLHNRSKFRVLCYANGKDDLSVERRTIEESCDEFFPVYHLSPALTAEKIKADGVDVLVDFDGLHHFNNLAVLALRPAPVQMTFLGFAATSGGDRGYIVDLLTSLQDLQRQHIVDYIVTDPVITPLNTTTTTPNTNSTGTHRWGVVGKGPSSISFAVPSNTPVPLANQGVNYLLNNTHPLHNSHLASLLTSNSPSSITSTDLIRYLGEAPALLPFTYQPQNWNLDPYVNSTIPTRESEGLPPSAFVFGAFNRADKITPDVWAMWMTILSRTTDSHTVLWLLTPSRDMKLNLIKSAARAGITEDRIIFAESTDKRSHLLRHTLADVFLDTLHYGAHTTASDTLYMGIPIITTPGRTFASRACSSIVLAAGLNDMVVPDRTAYVELAVEVVLDKNSVLSNAKTHLQNLLKRHVKHKMALSPHPVPLVHTPLFHSSLFTIGLEHALTIAHRRYLCAASHSSHNKLDGLWREAMSSPLLVSRRDVVEEYWKTIEPLTREDTSVENNNNVKDEL